MVRKTMKFNGFKILFKFSYKNCFFSYGDKLPSSSHFARKKAQIGGLQVGLNNMLTYLIYAVSVTFAGVLINTGRVTISQFITVFQQQQKENKFE